MRAVRPTILALVLALVGCPGPSDEETPPAVALQGDGRVESFDGVPIAYTVRGAESRGALVLIHGWSCDRHYWARQIEALSGEHRVVAVDLAGHGESGRGRTSWTFDSLGRDVQAVVDALELESVVLVGHSMGGVVALHAAAAMPERTIGVIGVDALQDFEFEWPAAKWDEWLEAYRRDFRGSCERMVTGMFLERSDPELVARVRTDMCSAPPEVAWPLLAEMRRVDFPSLVRTAGVPIRCINAASPATKIEINRRYADYDAYILRDAGHFPMLERPEEFDRLLARAVEELTSVRFR